MKSEFRISSISPESQNDSSPEERQSEIRMSRFGERLEKEATAEEKTEQLAKKGAAMTRVMAKLFETDTAPPRNDESVAQRFRRAALNKEKNANFTNLYINLPKLVEQLDGNELPDDEESLMNLYSIAENLASLSKTQEVNEGGGKVEKKTSEIVSGTLEERQKGLVDRLNSRAQQLRDKAMRPASGDLADRLEQMEKDDAEATEIAEDLSVTKNLPRELEQIGKLSESVQKEILQKLSKMNRAA